MAKVAASPTASGPVSSGAPRVAVIVPAYGVAHLVGEALASLQAQTLAAWECLVIDDGAPDDVSGAVAPFLADPRIRFLATSNSGVSAARNRAIAETTAPLITLLDGDDLLRPDYLATLVPILETASNVRLVTCNARQFGAVATERLVFEERQGRGPELTGSLTDVIDRSFRIYIGSTFRRADFDAIGGFDTTMAQSEDLDLWVRLMQLGGHARYVDLVLGDYRIRAGSASANATRMLLGNIKVFEKARVALAADRPEQAVLARAIAESRAAMAFEHAIDKVIDGDTRQGLTELRAIPGQVEGPVWRAAFAMWRLAPALARPMLRWRRAAHSRGAEGGLVTKLADIQL
jgi:glycosyltransferase involved in cell wall biosynthesis